MRKQRGIQQAKKLPICRLVKAKDAMNLYPTKIKIKEKEKKQRRIYETLWTFLCGILAAPSTNTFNMNVCMPVGTRHILSKVKFNTLSFLLPHIHFEFILLPLQLISIQQNLREKENEFPIQSKYFLKC